MPNTQPSLRWSLAILTGFALSSGVAAGVMPDRFSVSCDGGRFAYGATESEARAGLQSATLRGAGYAELFSFDLANRKTKMWWANKTRSAEWTIASVTGTRVVIYSYDEGGVMRSRTFDSASMLNIATARYTTSDGSFYWTVSEQKCSPLDERAASSP